MGISSDIMHDFVAKEIRAIYSSCDGWKITERPVGNNYDRIAVIERCSNGHRECVKILVTFARDFSSDLLDELKKPEPVYDGTVARNSFAVMIPANANMSSIPAGLLVHTMRSFAFDGRELAWVKKPVRKEEAQKAAA
ncbi:MAG: hypothetical protein M0Q92_01695 [Methanoregula sp.]|jgi:hypothetical protein|nr:hypothetical protein [Methanoregula sp.]